MTGLREHLNGYLAIRRSVGFRLERTQLLLTDFVAYLESEGIDTITVDAALVWAAIPPNGLSGWRAHRLSGACQVVCVRWCVHVVGSRRPGKAMANALSACFQPWVPVPSSPPLVFPMLRMAR